MTAFWFGVLGGFVAWIAAMLIGQPLYTFASVRHDIAKALYLFPFEGEHELEKCAGRLAAFTSTQPLAVFILRIFRVRAEEAAVALTKLSRPYVNPAPLMQQVAEALKIKVPKNT